VLGQLEQILVLSRQQAPSITPNTPYSHSSRSRKQRVVVICVVTFKGSAGGAGHLFHFPLVELFLRQRRGALQALALGAQCLPCR
jgi:hypothetical protein